MKFSVATPDGKVTPYEGQYTIGDSGVLSILPQTGNPVILSPSGWLAVEIIDAPSAYKDRGPTVL